MNLQKLSLIYNVQNLNLKTLKFCKLSRNFSAIAESTKTNDEVKSKPTISNPPFLKNIFAGHFDKNVLVFPESLSKNELANLEEKMTLIEKFSKQYKGSVNKEVMLKLRDLGLLSLQSNADDSKWSGTEMLRLLEGMQPVLCDFIFNHNLLGAKCVELYGSEEVRESVLPQLSSGNSTIAFCFDEEHSEDDLSQITTTAESTDDDLTYVLKGSKVWVSMLPELTDFFVVFAKVKRPHQTGPFAAEDADPVGAFLVEKSMLGKLHTPQPSVPSISPASKPPVYKIELENVRVPCTHVLGHLGNGFKIAVELIYGSLFLKTSHYASLLKTALGHVSKHSVDNKLFGKSLVDLPMVQEKVGRLSMHAYVMESMAYMTAGMLDGGCHGDVFVESACTQVYASEHLRSGLVECLEMVGKTGCYGDHPVAKLLESLPYDHLVSNSMLRRYIALNCLQHAGVLMQQSLRKLRNPLNNISHYLKDGWRALLLDGKNPPLVHRLHYTVHPDLSICAESLETRVLRIDHLVSKYWTTFFNKLEEEELALKRFSDITMNIYAVTSCLARATRSKSIGLRNADYEIMTCQAVIASLIEKIDKDLEKLELGDHSNGDAFLKKLGGAAFKKQAYPLEHPLTRNW